MDFKICERARNNCTNKLIVEIFKNLFVVDDTKTLKFNKIITTNILHI